MTFEVDTGFNGTGGLCKKTYDELMGRRLSKSSGGVRCATAVGGHADVGIAEFRTGVLSALRLAKWTSRDVPVTEFATSPLGLGLLSRYVVTFDFPKQVMYLRGGGALNRPTDHDFSGIGIVRRNGMTVVDSVRDNSPAAIKGIKAKDVLVSIDEKKAETVSLFAFRRALCCEGKTIQLVIRRGKAERLVSLTLTRSYVTEKAAVDKTR